jgi:hypothetical protein
MSTNFIVAPSAPGVEAGRDPAGTRGAWRLSAYATSLVFSVAFTLLLGKDVHWDALNYHLYLGYSALNDRFALDFFGAGAPSYLNPYAHVPLYLMMRAEWSAPWMAVALAAFHAMVLWLTFEIAMVAGLRDGRLALPRFAMLALLLAVLNPVLLQGLGSTMTDLSTGVFVLAGWLAITRALRYGGFPAVAAGGALCGIAAALKLSNAVFAIAAVPALLLMPGTFSIRARGIAVFCVVCGAAFAAVSYPWSSQLWREFGNPLFPFLNQYFLSPDFVTTPIRHERFIPLDWQAFVLRPFEMLSASSNVHIEPRAPDLRYVVLMAVVVAWMSGGWLLRSVPSYMSGRSGQSGEPGAQRALLGLLVGLAIAWCIWLSISGNSRYFLPMACVASVVLVLVLQRLFAVWPTATIGLILSMLAVQVVQLSLGTDLERGGGRWEGPWLRIAVPDRLRNEPHLYLSPSFLSGSAFLPYLHPQSGMINVGGVNVIGPRHPGGDRAQRLIEKNANRLRLLLPLPEGVVTEHTPASPPPSLRAYFRRFGLRIDGTDCEFMRVESNVRGERLLLKDPWKHFITCRLVSAPDERLAYERDVSVVDPIFDRVEDACPNLFYPARPVTQEFHYWSRTYHLTSEMLLFIDEGRVKYFLWLRGGDPIDIGSVEDWRKGAPPIDCSQRTLPAFVGATE